MSNQNEVEALKKDFRKFLWVLWHYQNLPSPSFVQYDIAEYLQDGPDRLMVFSGRGFGKTFITCAYACWHLWNNPNDQVLVVSATGPKANDFSTLIKTWIEIIPVLKELRSRPDQRSALNKFDVGLKTEASASASLTSYGITGQITGGRAHLIIADDIETLDNALTKDQRAKLLKKCTTEFESILHPGGKIVYLGTPQTEESIYMEIAENGYDLRIWPAYYPELKGRMEVYLAPKLKEEILEGKKEVFTVNDFTGDLTFPERFTKEDLAKRMSSMGKSAFMLQYGLNTDLADEDRYPLKMKDFITMNVVREEAPSSLTWASGPEQRLTDISTYKGLGNDQIYGPFRVSKYWYPYQERIMHIDPSGRGADLTVATVACYLNGYIHIPEVAGFKGGYDGDTLSKIAALAHKYQVHKIVVEGNFGDGMFTEILRPVVNEYYKCHMAVKLKAYDVHAARHEDAEIASGTQEQALIPPEIEEVRVVGMKEHRIIDTLEPLMNQHRVVIDYSVAQDMEFMKQVTRLQRLKGCLAHDDYVDSLAQACGYFVEKVAIDAEKMRATSEEEIRSNIAKSWDENPRMLSRNLDTRNKKGNKWHNYKRIL